MKQYIENLKIELGEHKVIDREDHIISYMYDESFVKPIKKPEVVVHPTSTQDVSKVMQIANYHNIPVVPRGGGTSLTGGSVPLLGGIVLSFDRMNKIKEINPEDYLGTVEPGVITLDFQKQAENQGLFYPPDPASLDSCSLGGNIAENAGGPRAFKYGTTKNYLLELEIVFANGEVYRFGRKTKKWTVGYNLPQFFVSSEGTLGIITEITLLLLPKPNFVHTLLIFFESEKNSFDFINSVLALGIAPRAVEFIDRASLDFSKDKLGERIPDNAESMVLVEMDSFDEDSLWKQTETIGNKAEDMNAIDIYAAMDDKERALFWEVRRRLFQVVKEKAEKVRSEDIVVRRSDIYNVIEEVRLLEKKYKLKFSCFAHAGDGNVHVNFLYDAANTTDLHRAVRELYGYVVKIGGTIAGEHGVGVTKQDYISIEQSNSLITFQKRLKDFFDPMGILNPGKIFP